MRASEMATELLNISTTTQPEMGETRLVNGGNLLYTLFPFLATWPFWRYIMTLIIGIILYDQGK